MTFGTFLSGMHRASREHFSVLVASREEGRTEALKCQGVGYLADPFLTRFAGGPHVFCEQFDAFTNRGRIVALRLDPKTRRASRVEPVLALPYHLSYPSLFEHAGELFMAPESHQNRSIDIYVCEAFPQKWKLAKRVLSDIDAADSNLFERAGRVWLVTSVRRSGNGRRLAIFSTAARDFPGGTWESHPSNEAPSPDEACTHQSGRSAGPLFVHDGDLVRPVQVNPDFYGQSLGFRRIEAITRRDFAETPVQAPIVLPRLNAGRGFHHVSFDHELIVVDTRDRLPPGLRLARALRRSAAD